MLIGKTGQPEPTAVTIMDRLQRKLRISLQKEGGKPDDGGIDIKVICYIPPKSSQLGSRRKILYST